MVENIYKQQKRNLYKRNKLKTIGLLYMINTFSFQLLLNTKSIQLNTTSKHILSIFHKFNQLRKVPENSFIEKSTFYKETKETK